MISIKILFPAAMLSLPLYYSCCCCSKVTQKPWKALAGLMKEEEEAEHGTTSLHRVASHTISSTTCIEDCLFDIHWLLLLLLLLSFEEILNGGEMRPVCFQELLEHLRGKAL